MKDLEKEQNKLQNDLCVKNLRSEKEIENTRLSKDKKRKNNYPIK